MIDRPPVDWSQPVQWNTGEPCTAERVSGFILIHLTENKVPPALYGFMRRKHFKDTLVVHEDDGTVMVSLADYPIPDTWVENVGRAAHPMEAMLATF